MCLNECVHLDKILSLKVVGVKKISEVIFNLLLKDQLLMFYSLSMA